MAKILIPALCAVSVLSASAASAQDEDTPSLEDVIAGFREWRSQFVTLEFEYEQTWPDNPEVTQSLRYNLLINDQGNYAYTTDSLDGGQLVTRTVNGADAETRFRATYEPNGDDLVLTKVQTYRRTNRNLIPEPILPLYLSMNAGKGRWLDELLSNVNGDIEIEGVENIGADPCVVLRIPTPYEIDAGTGAGNRLWLDISHGFFVRRVREIQGGGYVGFRYDCLEIQELEPGVFFPLKGTFGNFRKTDATHWRVVNVVHNRSVPARQFQAPQMRNLSGGVGHSVATNGRDGSSKSPKTGPAPPVASPAASTWNLVIAVVAGSFMLMAASFAIRRWPSQSR